MNLEASEARLVCKYNNAKLKMIKANLKIKFIKENSNATSKFTKIKINNRSVTAAKTKIIARKFWQNEVIKQLLYKEN